MLPKNKPNMNVNVTVTRFWFRFRIHGDDVEHVPKFEFELKRECGTEHELLAGSDSGSLYTISLSLSLSVYIYIYMYIYIFIYLYIYIHSIGPSLEMFSNVNLHVNLSRLALYFALTCNVSSITWGISRSTSPPSTETSLLPSCVLADVLASAGTVWTSTVLC